MVRKQPIMGDELHKLLDNLRTRVSGDALDAALLAWGWTGALRHSDLVSIDWQQLGAGAVS